jgi:hypothetical protein
MIRSTNRLFWSVLLVAGVVATSGCKKEEGRSPIDTTAMVGNWVEVTEQAKVNPRVADTGEGDLVRHLNVKADNTFVQTYTTPAGKETNDKIEGTWTLDQKDNIVTFEITDSTFGESDERRDSAPQSSVGVYKQSVEEEGLIEVLLVDDRMGGSVTFKRAG